MTNKSLLPAQQQLIASAVGNLDAYIYEVNRVPVLTLDEEQGLARRYRDEEDLDAARKMVMAHLRFVVHVAKGYSGYGLPLADLIQEGNIGLMKAVKRFDPDVGVRLVSFAVHWIRAEMHEYILRNWRIVKVATTKAQRKLFFNLRKNKKRLGWLSFKEVNQVASDLGVKPEVVLEMEKRLSGQDTSFDLPNSADDEDDWVAPAAYLQNSELDPMLQAEHDDLSDHHHELLLQGMDNLDQRSRDIISCRWLSDNKTTLQELADRYGVSAERIRQLESVAIKKMRASFVA